MSDADAAPVSPDVYTEEYYLNCASGFSFFDETAGLELPPLLRRFLDRMGIEPGMRVLDVGCGRGEVALNAALRGAQATGIDYADAALGLARKLLAAHGGAAERVTLAKCDAKHMPFPDHTFDRALMLDVVEHLQPWELDLALAEVFRVLKPGGRLYVHTMPNLHFYRWVYPPLRVLARVAQGKRLPRDPRSQYEHDMHVNEQTPRMVREGLARAGFEPSVWFSDFVRSPLDRGLLDRVVRGAGKRFPLRPVATFNIFAEARRPA